MAPSSPSPSLASALGPSAVALTVALVCAATGGCKELGGGVEGNGRALVETRSVPAFRAVKATAGLRVTVVLGPQKVVVRGEENLVPLIETKVVGGTLVVGRRDVLKPKLPLEVQVSVPALDALIGTSGATLIGNVKQQTLTVECSAGASCDAAGEVFALTLKASSGAKLRAGGNLTQRAEVDASSGAEVTVRAMASVRGQATSGAFVDVLGIPKEKALTASGGAKVKWK